MTGSYLVEAKYRMENLGFEPTEFGHFFRAALQQVCFQAKHAGMSTIEHGGLNWLTTRCSGQIGAVSKLEQPATPAFKAIYYHL